MASVQNAIIKSATLSTADHGILTGYVNLDYGGEEQGFGGYCLWSPKRAPGQNMCGLWVWRVMQVADVTEWRDLPGKCVRVRRQNGLAVAIGHVIKDDWFEPDVEFNADKE